MINKFARRVRVPPYVGLESLFRPVDEAGLSRGWHLPLIPSALTRRGGSNTYIEWGWTVGLFQPLVFQNLPDRHPRHILDIGCGVGRLAISCLPYLMPGDHYVGLEVNRRDYDYCVRHYRHECLSFIHFNLGNAAYSPEQQGRFLPWPVEPESFDLLTALSVWTHLNELDSRFYLKQVDAVLRPGGRAIISFFILDDLYDASLPSRSDEISAFYPQPSKNWIFDAHAYNSEDWFYPSRLPIPEDAIGIREAAFRSLIADAGLSLRALYLGCWKEYPGLFFQDIAIFEKP